MRLPKTLLAALLILGPGGSSSSNPQSGSAEFEPVWNARVTYEAERKMNYGAQKQTVEATYQIGWRGQGANKEYTFFNVSVSFSDRGDFRDEQWDVGDSITFQTADEIGAMAWAGKKGEFETLIPGAKAAGEFRLPPNAKSLAKGGYFLGVMLPVIGLQAIGDRQFITGESSLGIGFFAFYPNGKSTKEHLWVEISALASDAEEGTGKKPEPDVDVDEQKMEAQAKRWIAQLQQGREEDMRKEVDRFSAESLKQAGMTEFRGKVYSGSRTWKTQDDTAHTLTWSFAPAQEKDVEAVIIPEGKYKKWVPEARGDGRLPGPDETLTVKVRLQKKGRPGELPKRTAQFKFKLIDVSKELGICLNWPTEDKAEKTLDLKMDQADNTALKILDKDGQSAESKTGLKESEVSIASYDYGSYGILKVTAILDDGDKVEAHLENNPARIELKMPFDENDNHISDRWEDQFYLTTAAADSDLDSWPAGDDHSGDGLSVYEEYRGFKAKGKHIRTWPTRKDLFIYDKNNLGPGYLSKSGLVIHLVGIKEFGTKSEQGAKNPLVININQGSAHLGSQHLLMLENANIPGVFGQAHCQDEKVGLPKDCDYVFINKSANLKTEWGKAKLWQSIAHEMGHALNVNHHGDTDYQKEAVEKRDAAGNWSRMDAPADNPWRIAGPRGQHSGVEGCIMRYFAAAHFYESTNGQYRWQRLGAEVEGEWYPSDEAPGTFFCSQKEGTGVNDPKGGTLPDGRKLPKAGDAARGECQHQFCVNDRKH